MENVVLIEDEPWLAELYIQVLGRAGHRVRWCRDVYDGLDAIEESPPDVIVLDLLLPWVNGIQLLEALASRSELNVIPVILCSNALPKGLTPKVLAGYGVVKALDKAAIQPRHIVQAVQEVCNDQLPD